jgi:cell division FtsZ-interacting protein ZapD
MDVAARADLKSDVLKDLDKASVISLMATEAIRRLRKAVLDQVVGPS